MASFTHYWTGQTCAEQLHLEGKPLIHTAGNLFKARGVVPGDKVYVVSISKGQLYLIGRMHVDRIVTQTEAERALDEELWEAAEHVLPVKGSETRQSFRRIVPEEVVGELLFEATGKYEGLKYEAPGLLDRQTLRGVRRLTESSALLLDRILAGKNPS